MVDGALCDGCGTCIEVCVPGAITLAAAAKAPAVQSPHEER